MYNLIFKILSLTVLAVTTTTHPTPPATLHPNCLASVIAPHLFKRQGEKIEFGYGAEDGPKVWPGVCQTGRFQSPIDLTPSLAPTLLQPKSRLEFMYSDIPTGSNLTHNGHTIQVDIPPGHGLGFKTPNGEQFDFVQFHFHTPSEHRFDSAHLPMEMHMVHKNPSTNQIAVIGLLFQYSDTPTPLLSSLTPHLSTLSTPGLSTPLTNLPLSSLTRLLTTSPMWSYTGSLTTPPCSENVLWNVVNTPVGVSMEVVREMVGVMGFNSRFVVGNEGVKGKTETEIEGEMGTKTMGITYPTLTPVSGEKQIVPNLVGTGAESDCDEDGNLIGG